MFYDQTDDITAVKSNELKLTVLHRNTDVISGVVLTSLTLIFDQIITRRDKPL